MNSWAEKDNRIDAVLDYAATKMKAAEKPDLMGFIQELYKNAPPDDLISREVDELYAAALSLWKFSKQRDPVTAKLRIFNPTLEEYGWTSSHTIIQIVNRDMPFLLDSITSNLLEEGNDLHMLVHPIMKRRRDENGKICQTGGKNILESIMHIEITAMTDPVQLQALYDKLMDVMNFTRAAVDDWKTLLGKVDEVSKSLDHAPKSIKRSDVQEIQNFLAWLKENNFTLLGYREYNHDGETQKAGGEGFGILRDPDVHVLRGPNGLMAVSPEIDYFMKQKPLMLITKANVKSLVHRVVHLDYVGFKKFNKQGKIVCEARFVGLFTSDSYIQPAQQVPYLERKVREVVKHSGFPPNSHDGKALFHILETLPRDELFQIEQDDLFKMSTGILHLNLRPRAKAFIRKDRFERFVSALVFIPRDLYDSTLRSKVEKILCKAFNGELSSRYAQLSNDRIARWHFIIRTTPGQVPDPDHADINKQLARVAQSWTDYLHDVLVDRSGEEIANNLFRKYARSFSPAYRDNFDPRFAVTDVEKLEQLPDSDNIQFNFYRHPEDEDHVIRLKIYTSRQIIALSDCLPMLENMGLRVIEEYAFEVLTEENKNSIRHTIHDFYLEDPLGQPFDLSSLKDRMETALHDVWLGAVDNDGFNRLVLRGGLDCRQVLILRIYSKYLRQLGISYSESYMQDTLTEYVEISQLLVRIFEVSFALKVPGIKSRDKETEKLVAQIRALLENVNSLDQDRMLRSYLNVVTSSLRTNFYQLGEDGHTKPYISIKIKSRDVREAPKPRPYAEIFVYSPRVEGVHLRSGPVARGGLRWSDRREDYRTEVLGLVKAQQVKNTVIVPAGAKGGFVPKQMPAGAGREEILEEGIACYKIFISGLLDITDNLVNGKVIPPSDVIRRDEDDPYLVVAADKGTATFSDIANGLAQDYGFWLDDAFASGGSKGYDHKKMGITARGAWVSVQRHFREQGLNIQEDTITVAGIGDMSGDVFGNGMLCSPAIKLLAAFDHRDIFLDPNPDPAKSFKERARIFDLPRSSWEDYNKKLISKGGGIFSRHAKSINISPEVRSMLSLGDDVTSIAPNDLMQAILKSHMDLLWFGGIGTYIKAASESNAAAGDRANDAIRINGGELNCKVIGEGGNLGCTQKGRIEYALKGGMLNTDAVDNSAGVDCSDNEVNIKILLNSLVRDGRLTRKQRDRLLEDMTDDVAELVLRDNYLQSQAISLAQASSIRELDSFERFMVELEGTAKLDRDLEFLPTDDELLERTEKEQGLTRPEISVLIAYAKMALYDELMASDLVKDPFLEKYLFGAFPARLGKKYPNAVRKHQLRSEIVAMVLCNDIVNRGGIQAIREETGASSPEIARATIITREVFELDALWQEIEALDYTVPATIQTLLLMDVEEFARRQTIWFLNNTDSRRPIAEVIEQYKPGTTCLFDMPISGTATPADELHSKISMYCEQHVSKELAVHIANLETKIAACDIVQVAQELKFDIIEVAEAYFLIGDKMAFDWLRTQADIVETDDHWDRLAVNAVTGDLLDQQKNLTRLSLSSCSKAKGNSLKAAQTWLANHDVPIARIRKMVNDFQNSGQVNVTKLGFAARQIRNVIV